MQLPEDELIAIMEREGVDVVCTLPCERVKNLLTKLPTKFLHIPLTREEEGVGISAGAALAGRKPAMIIQNSGIGNMINALLSLTGFYGLPLALFLSHRGVFKEKIAAQIPMGKAVPKILKASGIQYSVVNNQSDLSKVIRPLERVYEAGKIHSFLLSPRVWEGGADVPLPQYLEIKSSGIRDAQRESIAKRPAPQFIRSEIIALIAPFLKNHLVVSTLGFPAKELYHVLHQRSNFYMLGSMGMATPIGLGIALETEREVFVIDGDGSLLMNPGTLATVSMMSPGNLTILAIDNGVFGSTGNQPTHTQYGTDLSLIARGFGLKTVFTVSGREEIISAMKSRKKGPRFIHILASPGDKTLSNIPLTASEIKQPFMDALKTT
jgi:sulfopyruvate decarboxylase subunit beta